MTSRLLCLALTLALALAVPPATAQNGRGDLAELEQYPLSMDNITRYYDTLQGLDQAVKADPSLKSALETDSDRHESFKDMEARLSSRPPVLAVITHNGLTPHTFVLTQFSFIQSVMAATMMPAGTDPATYARKAHINPANFAFLARHKDELAALQKNHVHPESDR